jgi:hypothetical protein
LVVAREGEQERSPQRFFDVFQLCLLFGHGERAVTGDGKKYFPP